MHFLRITDLSMARLDSVFGLARRLEAGAVYDSLRGKTCIAFFPDSSIRTRISFELAVRKLGGEFILFPSGTLDKREDLRDVISYIQNWADLCVVRHSRLAVLETMAAAATIPVINAMTGDNHPCEILGDLYAIEKTRGSCRDLVFTFVGAPGNILNSWLEAAGYFGFVLNHVSTEPDKVAAAGSHYRFFDRLDDILPSTDILLTDPLPESLRTEEYYRHYQITAAVLERAKPGLLLNPCPPFYRGEEVSADAIDSCHFVGYEFKKSLLAVQQSLIHHCLREPA